MQVFYNFFMQLGSLSPDLHKYSAVIYLLFSCHSRDHYGRHRWVFIRYFFPPSINTNNPAVWQGC